MRLSLLVAVLLLGSPFLPVAALAAGYNTPTAGQSPHGGYSDASTKCKVCHAVHNASSSIEATFSPPQVLLRTTRGLPSGAVYSQKNGFACVYCHITGVWSIKKVYDGVLANYQGDSRYNHDDNHRRMTQIWGNIPTNYVGCMSCHSVHGAYVLEGYEADIVKSNPNTNWDDLTVNNLTNFCRDCHEDQSFLSGKWGSRCGLCHVLNGKRGGTDDGTGIDGGKYVDNFPPFYTQSRNGTTHIMTATMSGVYGTQVAWSDSTDCRDCHNGGTNSASNSFPHFTSGAQFLDDNYVSDTGMDRVCLNCHVEGGNGDAYTTGVGKTF